MSDDVYATLSKLDIGLAKAYKKALGNNPNDPIDLPGAKAIFKQVIDSEKGKGKRKGKGKGKAAITTKEATALLYMLDAVKFTDSAIDYFAQSLVAGTQSKDIVLYEALLEGGAARQLQGNALTSALDLLDASLVNNLTFYSPGTSIPFSPHHYFTIMDLIRADEIMVFAMADGGLTRKFLDIGGAYKSDVDRLFLFQDNDANRLRVLIAHEITHAVQDWMDMLTSDMMAAEADAYIAGAVVLKTLGFKVTSGGTYEVAHQKAAPIVIAGNATSDNKAWREAYQDVKDAVGRDNGYYRNFTPLPDKAGQVEKDEFNKFMGKIKQAASTPRNP